MWIEIFDCCLLSLLWHPGGAGHILLPLHLLGSLEKDRHLSFAVAKIFESFYDVFALVCCSECGRDEDSLPDFVWSIANQKKLLGMVILAVAAFNE